jgi:hypothetical protein
MKCFDKLNFDLNIKIPVIFHNLNYDLRLILESLKDYENIKDLKINSLNINKENFKTFNIDIYQFIDSNAFLNSSLENLLNNLSNENKLTMKKYLSDNNEEKFNLINKKGHFPYKWFDSIEKFKCDVPDKEHFYNDLNDKNLTNDEYETLLKVNKIFNIKNFEEFHDLYLKRDVYGLCDVFENYRDLTIKNYGLDPVYYIGVPSLSWSCMLKFTKINLELLTDINKYIFFEKGIRGGLSKSVKRYVKANNKYCNDYDNKKESNYLLYIDANNLYGKIMTMKLPYKNFEWFKDLSLFTKEFILNYDIDKSDIGYTLEVDLKINDDKHNYFNDLPLCPEKNKVDYNDLSNYSKDYLNEHKKGKFLSNNKLLCSLYDKKNYVLNIDTLKTALSKGYELLKIHKVIKYNQKNIFKSFVEYNNEMRKNSKNEFEKSYYKLLNNSIYGKTMENVRNRNNIKICNNLNIYKKNVIKNNYKKTIENFGSENFKMIEFNKNEVKLNKPIYIGQTILDLSKNHMNNFYYDVLKKKYNNNLELVLTDTDSFIINVKTDDLYDDLLTLKNEYLDTNNYPLNHPLYSLKNKGKLGLFKDEVMDNNFNLITEIISLGSKVYSYKTLYNEKKTLKGVKKYVKDNELTFNHYYNVLFNKSIINIKQKGIRSYNLNNYSITENKEALNYYDDKRYILNDGINTLSYGHYSLNQPAKVF